MTLKQLEAFFWAANLGSFALAAERLFISQSSLSKRIAELESSLGETLFDRSARRAVVTEVGQVVLAGAKEMLALDTDLRDRVSRRDEIRGPLRIGLGELSAATWFPNFVKRVEHSHPLLVVEPTVSQARLMEAEVERGELDCAVIAGLPVRPRVAAQSLGAVPFAWMASPRLRGATGRPASLGDVLARFPPIGPNPSSGQAQAFSDWAVSAGAAAARVIRCNSLNAIVEMTVAGLGASLLPRQYLGPLVARGLLVELASDPPAPPLHYCVIWRRDDVRRVTRSARTLLSEAADFTLTTPLWSA